MAKKSLLRHIKIVPTSERLTQASGLGPMVEAFHEAPFAQPFYKCLPQRTSVRSLGSPRLALIQLSSFLYGHDAVDDLEEFEGDGTIEEWIRGEIPAPRTMGDFLRDFKPEHLDRLNKFLPRMSQAIYKQLNLRLPDSYKPGPLQLSIDSTPHVQHGTKMEGVAYNYDGKWCLDSQRISDQTGLTYGFQLRAGNVGKGVGASELILEAFRGMKHREEKYLSGDSAYLSKEVINACLSSGAFFTITAPDTIKWSDKVKSEHLNWQCWEYTQEQKLEAAEKGRELPKIELASYHWQPSWNNVLRFPVVIKRTWVPFKAQVKKGNTGNLFEFAEENEGNWEYYAVVTSMPLIQFTLQDVIERHNKRGNCERFIKEEKYGFDLLHFPCLKLSANYAYGLLAQVAHNVLRWLAVMERPHKPHFSKKLRRRFVYIPGKLVRHARQVILRVPEKFYEEVVRLREALQFCPSSALSSGSS